MWYEWILLIVGIALLIKGADFFVEGSSNIAKILGIPPLIVGLTLVSMGTSAPEASVSIAAAIGGNADISIGNVLGSNISNTLLILGVSSIIAPVAISKGVKFYDIPIMIIISGILLLFSFLISPGIIDRIESIVLIIVFILYITFLVLRSKSETKQKEELIKRGEIAPMEVEVVDKSRKNIIKSIIFTVVGLGAVIGGGTLVVSNAESIALHLGMSQKLVGLTIVAVGTSLPELVTSVVAAVKKENDIAIGNVVGSNIFNIVFVLGLSSVIAPIRVDLSLLFDTLIVLVASGIIFLFAFMGKKLTRWQGILLTLCYVGYLTFIIIRN